MNHIFSTILVFALLCAVCVSNANAQYAVTDAGSYTYYAQQVQQLTEQINAIKAQTTGQFQRLEDLKAQLSGQFSGLKQVYTQLSSIKQTFETAPTTLQGEAQKWTTLKDLVTNYTGIEGVLSDVFKDRRSLDPNLNKVAYLNRQYNMRQKALQSAIVHAEGLLQSVPDRMNAINSLQEASAKAVSMGDKQDMTNAILVEMLRALTTYSSVLVEFNQAAALMTFSGADENVMKTREQEIWKIKRKVETASELRQRQNTLKTGTFGTDMSSQNFN